MNEGRYCWGAPCWPGWMIKAYPATHRSRREPVNIVYCPQCWAAHPCASQHGPDCQEKEVPVKPRDYLVAQ